MQNLFMLIIGTKLFLPQDFHTHMIRNVGKYL